MNKPKPPKPTIGWREWVALPDLGVAGVKAKIDTGARSSCLHAFDIEEFQKDDKTWVRFQLHPIQKNMVETISAEAEILEYRKIRSSSGHSDVRPVIVTTINWNEQEWQVELTLTSRDDMGFRMLLGREAIRGRYIVDAGQSWFGGMPDISIRKPPAK